MADTTRVTVLTELRDELRARVATAGNREIAGIAKQLAAICLELEQLIVPDEKDPADELADDLAARRRARFTGTDL